MGGLVSMNFPISPSRLGNIQPDDGGRAKVLKCRLNVTIVPSANT